MPPGPPARDAGAQVHRGKEVAPREEIGRGGQQASGEVVARDPPPGRLPEMPAQRVRRDAVIQRRMRRQRGGDVGGADAVLVVAARGGVADDDQAVGRRPGRVAYRHQAEAVTTPSGVLPSGRHLRQEFRVPHKGPEVVGPPGRHIRSASA